MRRVLFCAAVGCLMAAPLYADKAETCPSFGTAVEFVSTPSKAAEIAKKEQKLVFVLHVSGKFEDPRFT